MTSVPAYLLIGFVLLLFVGMSAIDLAGIIKKDAKRVQKKISFNPKTLVVIPCKGIDFQLYENLSSIKNQRYRNFDAVCVVDSEKDEALRAIKKAKMDYLVSSSSCEGCSGKVRAISTAIGKLDDYQVYVIADSDIRARSDWLGALVAPLADKTVGLSTSYPYFNHIGGFWSSVKSVWGLVGEGLMENEITKFGWGGSLAFRKGLVTGDSFDFFKNSRYSVSDDICLTLLAKKKGLRIEYTGFSQPVVNTKDSFGQFFEWANRQTALSILGNRKNLYIGMPFYLAESILIVSGVSLSLLISPIFLLLLLHYLKSLAVTYKRSRQKGLLIVPITLMMPFLYLLNLGIASRMDSIRWRGSTYSLKPRQV